MGEIEIEMGIGEAGIAGGWEQKRCAPRPRARNYSVMMRKRTEVGWASGAHSDRAHLVVIAAKRVRFFVGV
jgi:hypothetical protein